MFFFKPLHDPAPGLRPGASVGEVDLHLDVSPQSLRGDTYVAAGRRYLNGTRIHSSTRNHE